jgi:tetratricopeptide (TPR) repeat protein
MTEPLHPKQTRKYLLAIFCLALILRLSYLLEASKSPLLFHPGLDPQAYDLWAQRIAGGEWIGGAVFYQSPLYPYLLGIFYALFGRHLLWVYIVQIVFGCLNCLVLFGIGSRVFGKRAGLLASLLAALYKPFIFYDVTLLKTFLEVFLADLCIYLLLLAADNTRRTIIFLAGLALGLGTLARDNFQLLILWFWPWLLFRLRPKGRAFSSLWLPAGFLLVLGVCAMRNLAAGRDLVLTTSQAGQNFFIGNHRGNLTGTYQAPEFVRPNPFFEEKDFYQEALKRTGRDAMRPSEVSNFWLRETLKEISADQKLFWKRIFLKLALFWNQREIADQESIYLFKKEFSRLLRLPLPGFGFIGPLGLLGMLLALRRKKGLLLAGYVLIYWVSVSAFYIFARYRLAVVGPVLVFAGFALLEIYAVARERKWKSLAWWTVWLLLFGTLVWYPLIHETLDYAYYNLGNSYARAGQYRKAITAYEKAVSQNPKDADFWLNLGKAREATGENRAALDDYMTALRLAPQKASVHLDLGIALFKMRDFASARKELEKALELDPGLSQAHIYLEMIAAQKPTANQPPR